MTTTKTPFGTIYRDGGGTALLMSTRNCQSVVAAKREAEALFGELDWRELDGDTRASAILEIE